MMSSQSILMQHFCLFQKQQLRRAKLTHNQQNGFFIWRIETQDLQVIAAQSNARKTLKLNSLLWFSSEVAHPMAKQDRCLRM